MSSRAFINAIFASFSFGLFDSAISLRMRNAIGDVLSFSSSVKICMSNGG